MAEIMAAVARVNFLVRRFERRHGGGRPTTGGAIPDFGLVHVVQPPDEFEEITGEEGIVLASGSTADQRHAYTVLVRRAGETYYLPDSALRFTGVVVPESDVYAGGSIRVRVDDATGEGRIVAEPA